MSIHAIDENVDPVAQAKIDLAAALRLAVYHELEEGIDNHFTVTLPGYEDRFMVLPFGLHWSEASASDMIVFNEAGETLEGEGVVKFLTQGLPHALLTRTRLSRADSCDEHRAEIATHFATGNRAGTNPRRTRSPQGST
jgi:hypothetical protein